MEDLIHVNLTYSRQVLGRLNTHIGFKYRNSRHVPVLANHRFISGEIWAVETHRVRLGKLMLEADYPIGESLQVGVNAVFCTAELVDGDSTFKTPDYTPLEFGMKAAVSLTGIQVENRFTWMDKTPVARYTGVNRPAHFEWDISFQRLIDDKWRTELTILNLANNRYWIVPGYDAAPTTVLVTVSYRRGLK